MAYFFVTEDMLFSIATRQFPGPASELRPSQTPPQTAALRHRLTLASAQQDLSTKAVAPSILPRTAAALFVVTMVSTEGGPVFVMTVSKHRPIKRKVDLSGVTESADAAEVDP